MKIAFPVGEKSIDAAIYDSFGRAPYFLIYDTVLTEIQFLDHRAAAELGASGLRAAQVLADNGVRAIVTPQCGENAEKVLRYAEVLVYKPVPGSIRQNIEAFACDRLNLLEEFKQRKND
jgi:predicted Fe-Mo cluster-binding NifX family protein